MSTIRQRIAQILRTNGVPNAPQAIINWEQSIGYHIEQDDDADAIAGVVLDTVDYAGAADRRSSIGDIPAPIPTMNDRLLDNFYTGDALGGGGAAVLGEPEDATYEEVRRLLMQNYIANPDAAIRIFMQNTGVQSFQGLVASQVAQAILGMQFPNRVAGRAPGPNAAAAAQFGMTQQQYQLYLATQLERQQRQAAKRQAAQRQAAQRQAAQRLIAQRQAAQAAARISSSGGGGAAPAQQLTAAQRQFQQILKKDKWATLTLQQLKQYVATRKSTLQKLLDDVKRDENVLNRVVVAMSYKR